MKYLIIEDEPLAQEELVRMLKSLDPNFELLASLYSVNESIEWLKNNAQPDIIFMDIHLSDNICFDIFDKFDYANYKIKDAWLIQLINDACHDKHTVFVGFKI